MINAKTTPLAPSNAYPGTNTRWAIPVASAVDKITNRIFLTTAMAAQGRLFFTEDTETYQEAVSMAVWDSTKIELIRLDDGSSDIDTLDASEYTIERDYKKYLDVIPGGEEKT